MDVHGDGTDPMLRPGPAVLTRRSCQEPSLRAATGSNGCWARVASAGVYLAIDKTIDEPTALKFVSRDHRFDSSVLDSSSGN